jgi:hypothetical protein
VLKVGAASTLRRGIGCSAGAGRGAGRPWAGFVRATTNRGRPGSRWSTAAARRIVAVDSIVVHPRTLSAMGSIFITPVPSRRPAGRWRPGTLEVVEAEVDAAWSASRSVLLQLAVADQRPRGRGGSALADQAWPRRRTGPGPGAVVASKPGSAPPDHLEVTIRVGLGEDFSPSRPTSHRVGRGPARSGQREEAVAVAVVERSTRPAGAGTSERNGDERSVAGPGSIRRENKVRISADPMVCTRQPPLLAMHTCGARRTFCASSRVLYLSCASSEGGAQCPYESMRPQA